MVLAFASPGPGHRCVAPPGWAGKGTARLDGQRLPALHLELADGGPRDAPPSACCRLLTRGPQALPTPSQRRTHALAAVAQRTDHGPLKCSPLGREVRIGGVRLQVPLWRRPGTRLSGAEEGHVNSLRPSGPSGSTRRSGCRADPSAGCSGRSRRFLRQNSGGTWRAVRGGVGVSGGASGAAGVAPRAWSRCVGAPPTFRRSCSGGRAGAAWPERSRAACATPC